MDAVTLRRQMERRPLLRLRYSVDNSAFAEKQFRQRQTVVQRGDVQRSNAWLDAEGDEALILNKF